MTGISAVAKSITTTMSICLGRVAKTPALLQLIAKQATRALAGMVPAELRKGHDALALSAKAGFSRGHADAGAGRNPGYVGRQRFRRETKVNETELTNGEKRLIRAALVNRGQGRFLQLFGLVGVALMITAGVLSMVDGRSLASFSRGMLLIGFGLMLHGYHRLRFDAHSLVRRLCSSPGLDMEQGAANRDNRNNSPDRESAPLLNVR